MVKLVKWHLVKFDLPEVIDANIWPPRQPMKQKMTFGNFDLKWGHGGQYVTSERLNSNNNASFWNPEPTEQNATLGNFDYAEVMKANFWPPRGQIPKTMLFLKSLTQKTYM